MNIFVNENGFGRKPAKGRREVSRSTTNETDVSKFEAEDATTSVRLRISWHVAAAQNVAILDVTGHGDREDLSQLASVRAAGQSGHSAPSKRKSL
jgi:hypothetical protein